MIRISPYPIPWNDSFMRLTAFALTHPCDPPSPPRPLVLAGWNYSNDVDKRQRWDETIGWATANGCPDAVAGIPDDKFLFVDYPTSYHVGPGGGPMYRNWDFTTKSRPSAPELAGHFEALTSRWAEIVGPELAHTTRPSAFTGSKARRLLVLADHSVSPPWGDWSHRTWEDDARATFTRFRAAINTAIAPHEVDHVDFAPDVTPPQSAPAPRADRRQRPPR